MLHVVKQIQRRFPDQGDRIIPILMLISALGALIGFGLLASH